MDSYDYWFKFKNYVEKIRRNYSGNKNILVNFILWRNNLVYIYTIFNVGIKGFEDVKQMLLNINKNNNKEK